MEGYIFKRGKRMGTKVRRYMRLNGIMLSNHHRPVDESTWTLDVRLATVTANVRRHRLTLLVRGERLDLFTETAQECDEWYEALSNAKSKALLEEKENESVSAAVVENNLGCFYPNAWDGNTGGSEDEDEKEERIRQMLRTQKITFGNHNKFNLPKPKPQTLSLIHI